MAHLRRADTIEHFTHPGHLLAEYNNEQGYLCDGCKTPGFGKRYRCHSCDFDLHDYCGKCPANLSLSFMHPHSLTLVVRNPQTTRQNDRVCNVCRDSVEGLFYRCIDCDFDLHPICTQLPESLTHVLHQVHPLKLEAPPFSSPCAICSGLCDSWRYRCGLCSFDIHLQCLLVSCEKSGSDQTTTTTHRGRPTTFVPPAPPQYPFHQQHSSTFQPYGFQFHTQPQPQQHVYCAYPYGYGFPVGPMTSYHMHHGYAPQPAPQTAGPGSSTLQPYGFQFHPQPQPQPQPQQHVYCAYPYGYGFPVDPMPSYDMHHGYAPQPAPQTASATAPQTAGAAAPQTSGAAKNGGLGKIMFALVKRLALGLIPSLIFGMVF